MIQLSCRVDQSLGEVRIDSPVASFVGIRQGVSGHTVLDAHVSELGGLRPQTGFDVAQTLAVGQLCECHATVLLGTAKRFDRMVTAVALDTAPHRMPWYEIHQLGEHEVAKIHVDNACDC